MHNKFDKIKIYNWILFLLFFLFATVYIASQKFRLYPFSYVVKIIPIFSLTALAIINLNGINQKKIVSALVFSAIGDMLLSLSGDTNFIFGIISFAIAHCFYIFTFISKPVLKRKRSIIALVFFLYGIFMIVFLMPTLGKMLIPVIFYVLIISLMGISAVLGVNNNLYQIFGAFLFIISDSVIALNNFYTPIPFSSVIIMTTYYTAQFLLIYGTIKLNLIKI